MLLLLTIKRLFVLNKTFSIRKEMTKFAAKDKNKTIITAKVVVCSISASGHTKQSKILPILVLSSLLKLIGKIFNSSSFIFI